MKSKRRTKNELINKQTAVRLKAKKLETPLKKHKNTEQHITLRKQAEEQIRRNEARLKSLVNLLQYNAETTQEFLDNALNEAIKLTESKIGYIYFYQEDRKQFVLNTWSKDVMKECAIVDPQTCYELDKTGIWGEAVRQRKPIILNDFQAIHPLKKGYPEGHAHLAKFMTVPVFKKNQIVAVVGVANKATDYDKIDVLQLSLLMDSVWNTVDGRRAEDALRESEQNYRTLADSGQALIWASGTDKLCNYFNRVWLEFTGRSLEQEMGNGWAEGVHPDDLQQCLDIYAGAFDRRETFSMEYRLRHRDGVYRWILDDGCPRYNSTGEFVGYIGHCLDVTEHKQVEENLHETAKEHENLIRELQHALENIKTLQGLIPICANCKKIRDDKGFWTQVEGYITKHTDAKFSHGICPDCSKELYGDLYEKAIKKPR